MILKHTFEHLPNSQTARFLLITSLLLNSVNLISLYDNIIGLSSLLKRLSQLYQSIIYPIYDSFSGLITWLVPGTYEYTPIQKDIVTFSIFSFTAARFARHVQHKAGFGIDPITLDITNFQNSLKNRPVQWKITKLRKQLQRLEHEIKQLRAQGRDLANKENVHKQKEIEQKIQLESEKLIPKIDLQSEANIEVSINLEFSHGSVIIPIILFNLIFFIIYYDGFITGIGGLAAFFTFAIPLYRKLEVDEFIRNLHTELTALKRNHGKKTPAYRSKISEATRQLSLYEAARAYCFAYYDYYLMVLFISLFTIAVFELGL